MRPVAVGLKLIARSHGDPTTTPFPSHRVMSDDAVRVEQLGFESVWLADHFYFEQPSGFVTFPEAWTPDATAARMVVGTPDQVAARLRGFADRRQPFHVLGLAVRSVAELLGRYRAAGARSHPTASGLS